MVTSHFFQILTPTKHAHRSKDCLFGSKAFDYIKGFNSLRNDLIFSAHGQVSLDKKYLLNLKLDHMLYIKT